jgi:periplasmic protein CpxP/Spy
VGTEFNRSKKKRRSTMRNHLRPLVLLTCISAATAFGSTLAMADTSSPPDHQADHQGVKGEQHRHGKGHRGHHHFKKMAKELGLTDQQKTQAKALFESSRAQNRPFFKALVTAKHDLRTLVQSGSADETAIRAQAAKLAAAEADLAVQRAQETRQFLALLTPEQVTKLKAIQAKREMKFQKFGSCNEDATK